jgi:enamine deaminase RidA (YjgF/YER057c/UK114 family)
MMITVFGDKGKHARSSVGMCSLPFDIAVELEVVAEVEE